MSQPNLNNSSSFQIGDRVVKIDEATGKKISGPLGTVQNIRVETTRTSLQRQDNEPLGVAVTVIWDNGTVSHFVPEALQLAK